MPEGRGKRGGDGDFEKEAKRLDAISRRKKMMPVLFVIVAVIAFSLSPWGTVPREFAQKGVDAVKTIFSNVEEEPDAKYW